MTKDCVTYCDSSAGRNILSYEYQMNIRKIIYLNCGERYQDMIIMSYTQIVCIRRIYYFQISLFIPEIFKFLKYAN